MSDVTIKTDVTTAMFLLTLVVRRLDEIEEFHTEHPNLPRQDDVKTVYEKARRELNEQLPENCQM
jgi:hypothetical protein